MPLNVGYVQLGGGDVYATIYYDATFLPVGDDQPLINGPRGWCLDMTNVSGRRALRKVTGVLANPVTVTIGKGDPVTTGPATGRSRTAAQMAALGFTTRGSLGTIELGDD